MVTNVFYRLPQNKGTKLITIQHETINLKQLWNEIIIKERLYRLDFTLGLGCKLYRSSNCKLDTTIVRNNSHVDILIPSLGGKGGFGSLLRAIGAQIEKTTNRDACRDLQGRRLRDVKKEDELRKLIALQEKLIEERKRRKKEKLEKLRKSAKQTEISMPIQELIDMFEDKDYNKRRHSIGDIIEAAVGKGIINSKRRQQDEADESSVNIEHLKKLKTNHGRITNESELDGEPLVDEKCSSSESRQVSGHNSPMIDTTQPIKPKAKDLWLGLESDEEDIIN